MREVSILSPAKLNLGLLVKEKRADNYHNIETILVAINLFDRIHISLKGRGVKVATDNEDIPGGENNLAYRASEVFYKHLGRSYGTEIFIENRIPPGRGLGGASSNAAQVLLGLNMLFDERFKKEELLAMALEVGSDAPFFIYGGACYATGRGEILEPIEIKEMKFFLHLPKVKVSTAWAYSQIRLTKRDYSLIVLRKRLEKGLLANIRRYLINDFEKVVFERYKELSSLKEKIDKWTLGAGLTGSGSGIYGILDKEERAIAELREEGVDGLLVRSLGRRLMGRTQDFGSLNGGSNPPAPV